MTRAGLPSSDLGRAAPVAVETQTPGRAAEIVLSEFLSVFPAFGQGICGTVNMAPVAS